MRGLVAHLWPDRKAQPHKRAAPLSGSGLLRLKQASHGLVTLARLLLAMLISECAAKRRQLKPAIDALADASRCGDSEVCARVHAMEPTLPIAPTFMEEHATPCIAGEAGGTPTCLPYVHVISGWHMFDDAALGFLKDVPQLESRGGGCFYDWGYDGGGLRWVKGWGGPPKSGSKALLMAHCNKLVSSAR